MYKELKSIMDESEWVTQKWGIQIADNFEAIIGGSTLPESITSLSNKIVSLNSLIQNYQSVINSVRGEMDTLNQTVNVAVEEVKQDMQELDTKLSSNLTSELETIWNNTGDKSNLYDYFNDVDSGQRRNLVLSINKLLDDIGFVSQLTTTHKITTVGAINELDGEIGNLSNLSTVNQLNIKSNIVEILNYISTNLIGDLNSQFTPLNSNLKGISLVQSFTNLDKILGDLKQINPTITGDDIKTIFNNINSKLGDLSSVTIEGDSLSSKILKFYNDYLDKTTELDSKIDTTKQELDSKIDTTKQELDSKIDTAKQELNNNIKDISDIVGDISQSTVTGDSVTEQLKSLKIETNTTKQELNTKIATIESNLNQNIEATKTELETFIGDLTGTTISGDSVAVQLKQLKEDVSTEIETIKSLTGDLTNIQTPYEGTDVVSILLKIINKLTELDTKIIELETKI